MLTLARAGEPRPLAAAPAERRAPLPAHYMVRLFLAAAFVTGAASFIYEIAWIRMLSLVLGSSFHAFELMLSAFITGLALGGLWIRRRIDRIADPVRFAGMVQLAMGLAALATIFVYHQTFDWMAWALRALQRTDEAYPLFNLFSHAHRLRRHAAGDVPRRHDAAAVHPRAAARRPRRARHRPGLLRQYAWRDRGRAAGRARAGAGSRA